MMTKGPFGELSSPPPAPPLVNPPDPPPTCHASVPPSLTHFLQLFLVHPNIHPSILPSLRRFPDAIERADSGWNSCAPLTFTLRRRLHERPLAVSEALTKDLNFPSYFAASSSHARARGANLRACGPRGRARRFGAPRPHRAQPRGRTPSRDANHGAEWVFVRAAAGMAARARSLSLTSISFLVAKNHKTYAFYARTDADAGGPWGPLR